MSCCKCTHLHSVPPSSHKLNTNHDPSGWFSRHWYTHRDIADVTQRVPLRGFCARLVYLVCVIGFGAAMSAIATTNPKPMQRNPLISAYLCPALLLASLTLALNFTRARAHMPSPSSQRWVVQEEVDDAPVEYCTDPNRNPTLKV